MTAETFATVLETTQSVCPVCLNVIEANIVVQGRAVYMVKRCTRHGLFTAPVWPDLDHYRWTRSFASPAVSPPTRHTESAHGCPQDCGLCQSHRRRPSLVEISLTSRCNLRCPVCFMAAGDHVAEPDPDLGQIEAMYRRILAQTGPQMAVQLTGGEPTVRRDLFEIIRMGRALGVGGIEINTNGLVIARDPDYAAGLAEAGLTGVYLQFDGLDPEAYRKIRGADILDEKLLAIEHCRKAGMRIVLSVTIVEGINDDQLGPILDFALDNPDPIVGIAYQAAFTSGRFTAAPQNPLTMGDVIFRLAAQSHGILDPYDFWPTGCSHSLCDATTYIVRHEGRYQPLPRLIGRDYQKHLGSGAPQGSVLPDLAEQFFPELEPGLSILLMNYMDAANMDLQRLRECSIVVADRDGRLVPFCSCQLTDDHGRKRSDLIAWSEHPEDVS